MATFVKVNRKSGIGWQAVIRRKGHRPLKKTFDLKGDAKLWAADQEALIKAKRFNDPRLAGHILLEKSLERYTLECAAKGKAATTLDSEKTSRRHLIRLLGAMTPLNAIKTADVNLYQNTRLMEKASNSSIRQELSMLSKMFRTAKKSWQLPVNNPVDDVERVPQAPGRMRFLSELEAKLVIDEAKAVKNKNFYPFVILLMHTGMRSGEVARLTEKNVDIKNRHVTIDKTKSGVPRNVPLTKTAAAALKTVVADSEGFYFLRASDRRARTTMLSPGRIFRSCWKTVWRRLEEKARDKKNYPDFPVVPHFTPHDIRHTAASHLLMAGVDIRVIADILGHSTLKMAMRYTHTLDSYKQDVIDKIDHLGE